MTDQKSRLDSLFEAVDIREVLATETEHRVKGVVDHIKDQTNSEDFADRPTPGPVPIDPAPVVPLEIEEPYDARKAATSLVHGLQALDQVILNPLALLKVRHSVGGSKNVKAMKDAYIKKFSGETLDEKEEQLVKALEDFERKMILTSDSMLPSQKRTEMLIEAAMPYCEETKMNVKTGLAFWGCYIGGVTEKITKIGLSL